MNAPSMPPRVPIQARVGTSAARRQGGGGGAFMGGDRGGRDRMGQLADADLDGGGEAGREARGVGAERIGREQDLHRHALDDLGEVAGGVVRRQERELGAGAGREAVDGAVEDPALHGVDACTSTFSPARRWASWLSLKLATTQTWSLTTDMTGWPGWRRWPTSTLFLATRPALGARMTV
jgi:hypothetical protein